MVLSKRKWSFRISIATLMIILTVSLSISFLTIAYRSFSEASEKSSHRLFDEISGKLVDQAERLLDSMGAVVETGAFLASTGELSAQMNPQSSLFFFAVKALQQNEQLHALFWEDSDGNLFRVTALRNNPSLQQIYQVRGEVAYVVTYVDIEGQVISELGLDASLKEVSSNESLRKTEQPYRPWHLQASGYTGLQFFGPDILGYASLPGISCVKAADDGSLIFGADMILDRFKEFVWGQYVSQSGYSFIFSQDGVLVAHPKEPSVTVARKGEKEEMWLVPLAQSTRPEVRKINDFFKLHGSESLGLTHHLTVDRETYVLHLAPLDHFGLRFIIAINAPLQDFVSIFNTLRRQSLLVALAAICCAVGVSFILAQRVSTSLSRLAHSAEKMQDFDFSEDIKLESIFTEIDTLIQSFSLMQRTVRNKTDDLILTQGRLKQLVDDGLSLASEQDEQSLIEYTFYAAKILMDADGGILFRSDEKNQLSTEVILNPHWLGEVKSSPRSEFDKLTLDLASPSTILEEKAQHAIDSGDITLVPEYSGPGLVPQADLSPEATYSVLFIPLNTRREKNIGLIQLVKTCAPHLSPEANFEHDRFQFVELLAAQAATAMDNQELIKSQQLLLDSFIKVIAGAIDAKSPHTGRHCSRVPELALLIAKAVHDSDADLFASERLATDEEWREFRIAAWLHDCGKVTTPDQVVNKATKLETAYNRIHEIRMRFEVLWRDLEIAFLKRQGDGVSVGSEELESLKQAQAELQKEFEFIALCNVQSETIAPQDRDWLETIAQRSWFPKFDDRLGLSTEESNRKQSIFDSGQPESLLADKPEHLIPFINGVNNFPDMSRFNLPVPQYRYHLGEIHNLLAETGTLTPEERYVMQEHSVQTILMLEQLPFPRHLSQVVEYACNHHEKMNGSGYPRGLSGNQMPVWARILAIADIFEALTAADRPYKDPMSVETALEIMQEMCDADELDADLFDLFRNSDVIETYSQLYLTPLSAH